MIIHPLDVSFDWKEDDREKLDFTECTYMCVRHYNSKQKGFTELPEAPQLKILVVNFTNAENLKGLEKYPELERLELYYCRNLSTFDGIDNISKNLKFLQIDNAKKLKDHKRITILPNIEELRFNDNSEIESIDFILKLKKLKSFCFVNTNVVNGDLQPLLEHYPPLESVGFLDKRHYSHKAKYIEQKLGCYSDDTLEKRLNPKYLPENMISESTKFLGKNKDYLKAEYKFKEGKIIKIDMAVMHEDMCFEKNIYIENQNTEMKSINGKEILFAYYKRGNEEKWTDARWSEDNISYSISTNISEEELYKVINGLK